MSDIFVKLNFPISISILNPSSGRRAVTCGQPDEAEFPVAVQTCRSRCAGGARNSCAARNCANVKTVGIGWQHTKISTDICVDVYIYVPLNCSNQGFLMYTYTHTTGNYLAVRPVEFNGRTRARVCVCVLKCIEVGGWVVVWTLISE